MNILTDEKLFRLNVENAGGDWIDFARAVESAVLEKLKQQKPVAWMMRNKAHGLGPSLHFAPKTDWHITWEAIPLYAAPMPDSDAVKALEAELEEQCRLNGMGAEREAKLIAQVENLQRELGNEKARGIHSCAQDCSRDGCVNRRLRGVLHQAREALARHTELTRPIYTTDDAIAEIDKALR